jgi:hypothetical protein
VRQRHEVKPGDLGEHNDGNAQGAEGHRHRVGHQRDHGGGDRCKTHCDEDRRGNRDGCPEPCHPLEEPPETVGDDDGLDIAIRRERHECGSDRFHGARLDAGKISEDGGKNDPDDGNQSDETALDH